MSNDTKFASIVRTERRRNYPSAELGASAIGVCPKMQYEYETGNKIPSPDVAYQMGLHFGPQIHNAYCGLICPIGRSHSKPVALKSIPQNVLMVEQKTMEIQMALGRLREIVCDGQITVKEEPDMKKIVFEIIRSAREEFERLELCVEVELMEKGTKEKTVFAETAA